MWFVNYASSKGVGSKKQDSGKREKHKYKKNYTIRDVLINTHSEKINKKVAKLSGNAKPGSPAWLKHYPEALTRIISKLSREETVQVERTIAEWQAVGPPDPVKSA